MGIARQRALRAGLASFADEESPIADAVRREFTAHLTSENAAQDGQPVHGDFHQRALRAARQEMLAMRASKEIGDDAFHRIEEELDWLEMAGRTGGYDE